MAVAAYRPWFERLPERFEEERAEMSARGFTLDAEAFRLGRVEFRGLSQVEAGRPLRVIYPGTFPSAPPVVVSRQEGGLLRRHQRPDSWELCLFGRKQSRWSAGLPGAAAVDEAEEVLRLFGAGAPPVPGDDVPEPASYTYPYAPEAAVLVLPKVAGLAPGVPHGTVGSFRLRYDANGVGKGGGRGVIVGAGLAGQSARDDLPLPGPWSKGQEQAGQLVYLKEAPPYMEGRVAFEAWVRREGFAIGKNGRPQIGWYAFIFPEESGSAGGQRLAWLAVQVLPSREVQFVRTYALRQEERDVRVPGLAGLAGKKVVIVGCGSLGAKIAVALAATGVDRFGLVDPDLFEPANTIRHEAGMEAVGLPKATALAWRLRSVHPLPESGLEGLEMKVGGLNHPNTEKAFHEMLASADLVVDATASHAVARHLTELCHDLGVPCLHATVTEGAWGGEVVRVVPGQTACWLCWLTQYENERAPAAPAPAAGVFAPGCAQPTFTGTTYEVGLVANLAAWAAVETLLRGEPGRADLPGNYVRWRGRTEAGLPLAATDFLPTTADAHCPICQAA